MGLTPLDIHNKEFPRKAFNGYDPDAVDEFLDQVIREFEQLIKENGHLRQKLEQMDEKMEKYQRMEEMLQKTLVTAQAAAEELKANAKREADLIIQQAHVEAERIVAAGQAKVRETLAANADLIQAAQTLRVQVRSLLVAQLQAIDQLQDPFSGEVVRKALTGSSLSSNGAPLEGRQQ